MLSLDAAQLAELSESDKTIKWCFELTDIYDTVYYWSTENFTLFTKTFEQKILNFSGIGLQSGRSELNIQSNNGCTFQVNEIFPEYFRDKYVTVYAVVNDVAIAGWFFMISKAEYAYKLTTLTCVDPISYVIDNYFPWEPLAESLFPGSNCSAANLCPPVVIGTGYVPCACVLADDGKHYYLLGPSSVSWGGVDTPVTYTVEKVATSNDWDAFVEFSSSSYTFNQVTKNGYVLLEPIVFDSDDDGTADACGLMIQNGQYLPANVKFSRSDLSSFTCPADVIKAVLLLSGVPAGAIDNTSFSAASTVFATAGITFQGGFFTKQTLRSLLPELLNQCGSNLTVSYQIGLSVKSLTNRATFGIGSILKDSFSVSWSSGATCDAGHVAWASSDTPVEMLTKTVCPTGTTATNISYETINMPMIHDSVQAQRAGIMYYQRKLSRGQTARFKTSFSYLYLQPDDTVTIDHFVYGTPAWTALIDTIRILPAGILEISCVQYSPALTDWGSITPTAVTAATDPGATAWQPVYTGDNGNISSTFNINASQVIVGNVGTGQGWAINDNGLFGYGGTDGTTVLEGHAFAVTNGIAWQRTSPWGWTPENASFTLNTGDMVIGGFNYGTGIFWDQSAQELHIKGSVFSGPIFDNGAIDYSKISSGPPGDADKTSTAMYSSAITKNTGVLTLNAGADLIFYGNGSNTSQILFKPTTGSVTWINIESVYEGSTGVLNVIPYADGNGGLQLGNSSKAWDAIGIRADTISFLGTSLKFNASAILTADDFGTESGEVSQGNHNHYGMTIYIGTDQAQGIGTGVYEVARGNHTHTGLTAVYA